MKNLTFLAALVTMTGVAQAQAPQPTATPVPAPAEEEAEAPGLRIGADAYYGFSNIPGFHRARDGQWSAGLGPAYPSNVYARWRGKQEDEAKVAVSIGKLYNGSSAFEQPVEAWYKRPLAGGSLTAGKFYVPFALAEWEYETKWGAQWDKDWNGTNTSTALTYNRVTHRANAYGRVGRDVAPGVNVGVSLAAGTGLTYDTAHDKALGLDISAERGPWRLTGEYMGARGDAATRFRFAWLQTRYEGWKKVHPFFARHDYKDNTGALGALRSYNTGATFNLRDGLDLDAGYALTSGPNVWWIQLHWTGEKLVK